jgi:hypothetical protein
MTSSKAKRIHRLRSTLATTMQVLTFISLARKVGLRRIGRVALTASEMYLTRPGRGRGRRRR